MYPEQSLDTIGVSGVDIERYNNQSNAKAGQYSRNGDRERFYKTSRGKDMIHEQSDTQFRECCCHYSKVNPNNGPQNSKRHLLWT